MQVDVMLFHELPESAEAALASRYSLHRLHEVKDRDRYLGEMGLRIRACITHELDRETMAKLPSLELICKFGIGMDDTDLAEAKRRGIRVAITPHVVNDAVAELAVGLMIGAARQLVAADWYIRDGKWTSGKYPSQHQLAGKTAGILGLGRMGKEIASRCQAMKMRVLYCGRTRQQNIPYPYYEDLVEMAREADFLVVVVPNNPATHKIVSREVLEALGARGYLINVSRGQAIDEPALVEMLVQGKLAGAGLDVFADEPNVPEQLKELPNVILSPHQGVYTHETLAAMGRTVLDNIDAHFSGEPMPTVLVVDRSSHATGGIR